MLNVAYLAQVISAIEPAARVATPVVPDLK